MKPKINAGMRYCFKALLIVLLAAGGCAPGGEDSFGEANKVSLVVALCKPVMKDNHRVFQIVEIWRDESRGEFSKKVGDVLDDCRVCNDNIQEGLLFWGVNHGQLIRCYEIYIYDGIIFSKMGLSVEDTKQIIQNTKPTPVDLNIPVHPWTGEGK